MILHLIIIIIGTIFAYCVTLQYFIHWKKKKKEVNKMILDLEDEIEVEEDD